MASPTPIITKPPPTRPASASDTSIKPQGLNSWRQVAKEYSTWALAAVLAAPELYHMAATFGMLTDEAMPQPLMTAIRAIAGVGLVLKFVSQKKPA